MGANQWRVVFDPMMVELLAGQIGPPCDAHDQFQHDAPFIVGRGTLRCDSTVRVKRGVVQIGQLSRETGVSVRMLRYYEREGLLRPDRTHAGYRRYNEDDVAIVRRIILLNGAGLRLATIRPLLPCDLPPDPDFEPCPALKASLRQTLTALDQQMAQLSESRKLLASLLHLG